MILGGWESTMTTQRANLFKTSSFMAVCALALGGVALVAPTPADAQFGFGFRLPFFCCHGSRHHSRLHHASHHHTDGDEDDDSASSSPSSDDSTRELAKLA